MRAPLAIAALAISAQAVAAPPDPYPGAWHCTFTEKLQCDPGQNCRSVPSTVSTIMDQRTNRYMRCSVDFRDCDEYDARFSTGGDFLNVDLPGRSVFAKLSTDLSVTEVAALGHSLMIGRGRCEVGPPPLVRVR